jgi:hypothetical protein
MADKGTDGGGRWVLLADENAHGGGGQARPAKDNSDTKFPIGNF